MKLFTAFTISLFIALSIGPSSPTAAQYSPEIYQAQKALKQLGYDPGKPDGLWGKATGRAVKYFQVDNELPVTGKLDEQTKAKLGIVSTARSAKRNQPIKERRLALVSGNSAYKSLPLKNPVNDAQDMADALKVLGFNVIEEIDADRKEMEDAIRQFGKQLKGGGTGFFYYAGHGIQVKGRNYLIPVGARIESESDARYQAVDAGMVLGKMEDAENDLNIVVLDACRDNPFSRSFRSREQGLAKMDAPKGSLIAYATAPGSVAADGAGRNGIYTKYLLKHMKTPGLTIERVLKFTRNDVMEETGDKQVPWESTSLTGDFYFASSGAVVSEPTETPSAPQATTQLADERAKLERQRQELERLKQAIEREKLEAELEAERKRLEEEMEKALVAAIDPKDREIGRDEPYIAYDNGTVKDTETGLMWAAKDNGGDIDWRDAKRYCENYRGGGYTDWRMPTWDEVAGLYDKSESYQVTQSSYTVHLTELIELSAYCPWASETRGSLAANFDFSNGNRFWSTQSYSDGSGRALPVRSGVTLYAGEDKNLDIRLERVAPTRKEKPSSGAKTGKDTVTGMEFVWVTGGCYEMGCGSWDGNCDGEEKPVHKACVDGFWMGKYEVTQGQWKKVMGSNPSRFRKGDNYPVERVSWNDAKKFIKAAQPKKRRQ